MATSDTDLSAYDGRSILFGPMSTASLWVDLAWAGQDQERPFQLPDGRNFDDVIASGQFGQVAETLWLEVANAGQGHDILWTTGMALTVVSLRLAEALAEICGEGEFEVFPVTVRRPRSPDIDDYAILVTTGEGPDRRVREFPLGHRATSHLDVDGSVLAELRARGISDFAVEDARQKAGDWADAAAREAARDPEDSICTDAGLWDTEAALEGPAQDGTVLALTINAGVEHSVFEVPAGVVSASDEIRVGLDDSVTMSAADGAVAALSRPMAQDRLGSFVNAFWFNDGPRLMVNVDHHPELTEYPVTVRCTLN